MALPPGSSLPAVAQTMRWAVRPIPLMERCLREYGECFTVRLAALGEVVFLADPAAIGQVFTAGADQLTAGEGNAILEPVVGPRSVLLLDGPEHLRERRLLLPSFHGDRTRGYGRLIAEVVDRDLDRWPLGAPFALRPRMQAITLEVIIRAVFGVRERNRVTELGRVLSRMLEASSGRPLMTMLPALRRDLGPWSPWARFTRARDEVDEVLFAEIARRRRERAEERGTDVLSTLIAARHEDGRPMSDAELRDELATLLVAGHETTATALAWAFERLLRHPSVLRRLVQEVERGDDAYLDAVVKETLRLRPVLSIVVRRLAAPMELGGHRLPAGTHVAPCIYLTHRLPRLYPRPAAFRPERFLDRTPDAYAWIPFGGGVRRCLGAGFATLEMKEVLRTVLRRARLRAPDPRPESARRRAVTLAPSRDALAVMDELR